MEHRQCERKAIALDAVVACTRFGLIRGRIVDLGVGGLYIRAETSIVPIGAEVTVTFQPAAGVCQTCMSLKGRVAHQSLHGFGVAFGELDAGCRRALRQLLPGQPLVTGQPLPVMRTG